MRSTVQDHFPVLNSLDSQQLNAIILNHRGGMDITPTSVCCDRKWCAIAGTNLHAMVYNIGKGKTCVHSVYKQPGDIDDGQSQSGDKIGAEESLKYGGTKNRKKNTTSQKNKL